MVNKKNRDGNLEEMATPSQHDGFPGKGTLAFSNMSLRFYKG